MTQAEIIDALGTGELDFATVVAASLSYAQADSSRDPRATEQWRLIAEALDLANYLTETFPVI